MLKKEKINEILYVENFKDIIKLENKKTFYYLHLNPPHPPFIYNPDCSQKKLIKVDLLTFEEKKRKYKDNFKCAEKIIQSILEKIIESDKSASIIFMGDHGPHLREDKVINYLSIMDIIQQLLGSNQITHP